MPHVTEKAVALAGKNQYVFRVAPHSTKHAVKQAVEEVYGVEVRGVHVISVPSKRMRRGRIQGKKPGYRKAIVRVKEGQKIDILPV
ncbi:50S ribosomal protein L23 [Patescibacteria group bacterium]|nr:50S ribosomal protein L23 [Patescibacteria group bacterium]